MQSTYDVIIIGAGPAGLLCATWLARRGVNVGIFEEKDKRPARGRADGFEPRTLEVLNSFGLLNSWWRDANQTVELSVWVSRQQEQLQRILRRINSAQGTSEYCDVTMDQAVLEREMEEQLRRRHGVAVQYGSESLSLMIKGPKAGDEWPVRFVVKQAGCIRKISAKYAVGADGGHSWTRKQAGIRMETSRTTQCWGVADIHPMTDFPDIRSRCIIHAEGSGTLMIIPREAGMVRIYVQLGDTDPENLSATDASDIVAVAQRIMTPFKLAFRNCYWSSHYQIQQGLATRFSASEERVLLIGDAVHTHSPKAGMGLNVSLQDAYNLGWKLAAVVRKEASPRLLTTYEEERRPVAEFLVNFDRDFLQIFQAPLSNMSIHEYRDAVITATTKEHADLSGVSVSYAKGLMFRDVRFNQYHLASRVTLGTRVPPATVVNHSDGRLRAIHDLLPSDGQWRLVVFPGDLRDPRDMHRYAKLGKDLEARMSFCGLSSAMAGGNLDIITVHRSPRHQIDLLALPDIYHPWSDKFGWNYNRVFTDGETLNGPDHTGRVYEQYGIISEGCVLLLRPDQHVVMIAPLNETAHLYTHFMSQFSFEDSPGTVTTEDKAIRAAL